METKQRALTLLDEFRNFAFKGNVVDLAIAVIVGGAFGKVVESLVKNVLMPAIGAILPGRGGYLGWKLVVLGKDIPYGLFIGDVVNFLLISLAVFLFIVKFLSWLLKMRKEEAAAPPPPTKDQELLAEIRDLLKAGRSAR